MKISKVETAAPVLRKLTSRDHWEYVEEWKASIYLKGEGVVHLRILPGYWTDLASVPQALRGAFDNGSGSYGVLIASQAHDLLYSTHYLSRKFADNLFHALLRYYGVGAVKAWFYYQAVHLFGGEPWERTDAELNGDRQFCRLTWLDR